MIILNLQQGTPEWLQARAGRATASKFKDILAKGQGKSRASYLRQIVAERLTGQVAESYKNANMERGHEHEPDARALYEIREGVLVDQVGLILHDDLMVATSPDHLVGSDGGGEIKSVLAATQIDTILGGEIPSEHKAQIQGNLWNAEREWWDFISYCPEMPENTRLFVLRCYRDEPYIKTLEAEIRRFLDDVDETVEKLRKFKQEVAHA